MQSRNVIPILFSTAVRVPFKYNVLGVARVIEVVVEGGKEDEDWAAGQVGEGLHAESSPSESIIFKGVLYCFEQCARIFQNFLSLFPVVV